MLRLASLKWLQNYRFLITTIRRPTVGVIILANSATDSYIEMTQRCIDSIHKQNNSQCEIVVVESGPVHRFENACVIKPDEPFNYNLYLQIGIRHFHETSQVEYFVFLNNDLICFPNAIDHLISSGELSSSPVDPLNCAQKGITSPTFGYSIRYHVVGWAICTKATLVNRIGPANLFPVSLEFFYQDDFYAQVIKGQAVRHAVIPHAKIVHLESRSHSLRPDFSLEKSRVVYESMSADAK